MEVRRFSITSATIHKNIVEGSVKCIQVSIIRCQVPKAGKFRPVQTSLVRRNRMNMFDYFDAWSRGE